MKALESLRVELVKQYPGDSPAFGNAPSSPEETEFFFKDLVVPAFEKIKKEFDSFHFRVSISIFSSVVKLEIKDACSFFSFSIRTDKSSACIVLLVTFRDFSVSFPGHIERKQRTLLEERFDLSKINQVLPEELILTIFTDTFLNRTIYLKRIAEAEIEVEREKEQLIREERRARFIFLKRRNNKFDPDDDFKKYLDNPDFGVLMRWTDDHYKFRPDY